MLLEKSGSFPDPLVNALSQSGRQLSKQSQTILDRIHGNDPTQGWSHLGLLKSHLQPVLQLLMHHLSEKMSPWPPFPEVPAKCRYRKPLANARPLRRNRFKSGDNRRWMGHPWSRAIELCRFGEWHTTIMSVGDEEGIWRSDFHSWRRSEDV